MIKEGIEKHPNESSLYVSRSEIHKALGNSDAVLEDLTKAVKINPKNLIAKFELGNTNMLRGEYELANMYLSEVLEEDKHYSEALVKRSYIHFTLGNAERALNDLLSFKFGKTHTASAFLFRGIINRLFNEYENCQHDLVYAIVTGEGCFIYDLAHILHEEITEKHIDFKHLNGKLYKDGSPIIYSLEQGDISTEDRDFLWKWLMELIDELEKKQNRKK